MRKTILSACLASLALGCNEPGTAPAAAPVPTPGPVLLSTFHQPSEQSSGTLTREEPEPLPDLLGLEHSHSRKVDHLARARQLKSEGDLEGAISEARRAVHDDPADEQALTLLGRVARLSRQKEVAERAFGRLAELRPEDAVPAIKQARTLLSMGDPEGAVKAGQQAILRDPHNPEGYQVVGRAQLEAGELPAAISMFQKAVELDPGHGYAWNNLGFACLRANENEQALQALERAAELLPSVAYVHNNLGVARERTFDLEGAKQAYGTSTSLSPKYVKARVNATRVAKAELLEPDGGEVHPLPELELPEE